MFPYSKEWQLSVGGAEQKNPQEVRVCLRTRQTKQVILILRMNPRRTRTATTPTTATATRIRILPILLKTTQTAITTKKTERGLPLQRIGFVKRQLHLCAFLVNLGRIFDLSGTLSVLSGNCLSGNLFFIYVIYTRKHVLTHSLFDFVKRFLVNNRRKTNAASRRLFFLCG